MIPIEKLTALDGIYGVWHFKPYLRVTYVSQGWLIVWDHRSNPPERYDCKAPDHSQTCAIAADKLRELSA